MMENLQNEIVEKAAELASNNVNEAVETKAAEIKEEVAAKTAEFDAKLDKFAAAIDQIAEKANGTFAIGSAKKSPKEELMAKMADSAKNIKKGQSVQIETKDFGLSMKDFTISAGADNYGAYSEATLGDAKYDPNYQTRLTNFLSTYSLSGNGAIRYNQESANTGNPAAKNEGASFASKTMTLQPVIEEANTIGAFVTAPREHLVEVTGINGYLSQRLMGDVLDVVDDQILTGNGTSPNWTGINSHVAAANDLDDTTTADAFFGASTDNQIASANNWDVLNAVAAELEGNNFRPNLVILNPVDYRALSWIKSSQGEYVINQAMQANQPWIYFNSLRIVPNAAQTLGDFTLVDTTAVGLFLNNSITLEMGLNDQDFQNHDISMKAYVRGGVAGFRPNGLTTGTFSVCRTSIASA